MNPPTESEILFEKFCAQLRIPFRRVGCSTTKTPDYDITLGGFTVVAEVKQLDQNEDDKEGWAKLKTGVVAEWVTTDVRVRRKVKKAEKQLNERCHGTLPGMLVLYDNGSLGGTDVTDIKTAMFGDETVKVLRRKIDGATIASAIHPGCNGVCTKNDNTTVSAVGLFFWLGDGYQLSVFHNHNAAVPTNPGWFRHERFQHFGLHPDFYDWRPL
jgi:hypothetical protein